VGFRRRAGALALALVVCALARGARAGDVTIEPEARKLFEAGVELLDDPEGPRYERAYRSFKAAYEISPSPRMLGNIGLCAMMLQRDGEAIDAYTRYLAEVKDIDPEERAQIEKDLKVLEAEVATLTVETDDGGTVVDEHVKTRGGSVTNRYGPVIGGRLVLRLRPGTHRLSIETSAGASKARVIELAPGQSKTQSLGVAAAAAEGADPSTPAPAAAARLPLRHVARPLTMPQWTVAPELRARVGSRPAPGSETGVGVAGFDLGASLALLDDLQLDVRPLPLEVAPDADFGTASGKLTYRYLDGVVEIGNSFEAGVLGRLDADGRRRFFMVPSLPVRFHLWKWGRLDTGFELPFLVRDRVQVGMLVPLDVSLQLVDWLYAGVGTGFGIGDFDAPDKSIYIPVGALVGATIAADDQPRLDVELRFSAPVLFLPADPDDKLEERFMTGMLVIRPYFFL
jgi:hypothetical protein